MCRHLLFPTLLIGVCTGAFSLDYQSLLDAVRATDPTAASLEIAGRQAEVSLAQALVARNKLLWTVQTGEARAEVSSGSGGIVPSYSARPQFSVEWPQGPSVQGSAPITGGEDAALVVPSLGLSLPLLRGPDQAEVAVQQGRLAVADAQRKLASRRIVVEKTLVERLIALYRASAAMSEAHRKLWKAEVELTRAVSLDGAVEGGKAYLDGDRAVRIAAREAHRADSAYRQQVDELALLSGLPLSPDFVLDGIPETDLALDLPEAATLPLVQQARDTLRFVAFRSQETAKDSVAALKLGGGYGLGTLPTGTTTGIGLDVTSGLAFSSDEWATTLDLGWNQTSGPRLQISLAWKPRAVGEAELKGEATKLELVAQEQAVNQALAEGTRALKSLDQRRAQLKAADQGLAEDLQWAVLQVERYQQWRAKALVTQTELDEVEATLQSVRTEGILQRLDCLDWALERRMLLGKERD